MTRPAGSEELSLLRLRAYGPDADIHVDPAALARLHELEGKERSGGAAPPDDAVTRHAAAPAADGEPLPTGRAAEAAPETSVHPSRDPDPAEEDAPEARPVRHPLSAWLPKRRGWWAASLVVAAAAGVAITLATTPVVARTGDGREVAVLAEDPGFERPDFLGVAPESLRGFEEFLGLTVFTSKEEWIGGGTDECLLVVAPASEGQQRQFFLGCGVGAFSASVQFRVQPGMPEELRERYPEGTPLQFLRDGGEVRVLVGDDS
jgi:hypothetical protein